MRREALRQEDRKAVSRIGNNAPMLKIICVYVPLCYTKTLNVFRRFVRKTWLWNDQKEEVRAGIVWDER